MKKPFLVCICALCLYSGNGIALSDEQVSAVRDLGWLNGIALQCGYFDQSAFARQFKSLVGLTPRQYREHHAGPTRPA